MPADVDAVRARSGAEVTFVVLRALVAARVLWAGAGALPLDALPALLALPVGPIASAVEWLCEEGIVELSARARTVRLTERAARELVGASAAHAAVGAGSPAAA